ncbi:MAG: YncE family protein [Solirubrobacterales bacterium]
MNRRMLVLVVGLVILAHPNVTTAANGKGIPVTGLSADSGGLTAPGSDDRYVALEAIDGTVLARLAQDGGEVIRARSLNERLTTPPVALDGTAGGLSADGRTLVLVPPRTGLALERTRLEIFDAATLRGRDEFVLRGDFSFDAISPDGSRIYLIEYLRPGDPTRYRVRALDAHTGRLLPDPIVDPEEPPGEMRGYPLTRATSPDGRWAYTLYDGGGDHPFIHALDTVEGRAVCIDVHPLAGHPALRNFFPRPISRFELAMSKDLTVLDREQPIALVDTQTFEVSEPSEASDGNGFPWALLVLAPIALMAAWVLSLALRKRRHGVATGGVR